MILLDASVWIDDLRDISTPQTRRLRALADEEQVALGDLTLAEVLRGCRDERDAEATCARLLAYPVIDTGGTEIAVAGARNYRALRARGVTAQGRGDGASCSG